MEDYRKSTPCSDDILYKIALATTHQLLNPRYLPRTSPYKYIRNLAGRIFGRSLRLPDYRYFWTTAVLADGLVEYYRVTQDEKVFAALKKYHSSSVDKNGYRKTTYVDEAMNAASLLELSLLKKEEWMKAGLERFNQFLLEVHPKTWDGVLPYRSYNTKIVLVDTIGMVCPFLSKYYAVYGDEESLDLALGQALKYLSNGLSSSTGLPYHGYNAETLSTLGGDGWGRGVGWLLMGLSEVLICMPADDERYGEVLTYYKSILEATFARQNQNGSFNEILLNPNSGHDSSATSMIAYACVRTVENGIVGASYFDKCSAAFRFLKSVTDVDGNVNGCSGEALGANHYATNKGCYPWAQGPALALGAVLKRYEA